MTDEQGFDSVEKESIVVRYRSGTAGEQAAKPMASAAAKARERLAGLGSEPEAGHAVLYLQDQFPDPDDPDRVFADSWQRFRGHNLSYCGGADSGIGV